MHRLQKQDYRLSSGYYRLSSGSKEGPIGDIDPREALDVAGGHVLPLTPQGHVFELRYSHDG